MNRLLSIALLALFCLEISKTQSASPLFQVIASDPLINRSSIFRDLQDKMVDELSRTEPGLHLNIFYGEMSDARRYVLNLIPSATLDYSAGDSILYITLRYYGGTLSDHIKITDAKSLSKTPKDILNEAEGKIANDINSLLERIDIQPSEEKEAILTALIAALEEGGLTRNISTSGFESSVQLRLAKLMSGMIFKYGTETVLKNHPDWRKSIERDTLIKLKDTLNAAFKSTEEKAKQIVSDAMDKAESKIADLVDNVSRRLVSGNVGIGVTQGTGAFVGGVQYSFVLPSWQFGLYTNGQFNNGDSTRPTQSLLGIRVRCATEAVQFDLLHDRLFGDKQISNFRSYDVGIGISYRISKDMIIGSAYFNQHNDEALVTQQVGVTFATTSPGSPSLLMGFQIKAGDTRPVFQISFPVNATK
jgi:hypothetical protein